jgi:hypothetical protein
LIDNAVDDDALRTWFYTNSRREFAFAFEDNDTALLDSLNPLWDGTWRSVADNEEIRGAPNGSCESDGGEDLRPGAGIVASDVVVESGGGKRND